MAKQIVPLTPAVPATTAIQDPAARQFANAISDMLRSAQSAEWFIRQMEQAFSGAFAPASLPSFLDWLYSSELYLKLSSTIERVDVESKRELLAAMIAEQEARAQAILDEQAARAQAILDERTERINEIAAEAAERILLGVNVEQRIQDAEDAISEKTLELIRLADEALDKLRFERNVTDATIDIDPANGQITLKAVEAYRDETTEQFNQVAISLNAQNAQILSTAESVTLIDGRLTSSESSINQLSDQITLKASVVYVDQAIANAVIDPSQVAELGEIYARLNTVEVDLNAAEAAITLKADQLTVASQGTRLTTAEQRLDGAEAAIELKASQIDLIGANTRITDAELRLDGAEAAILLRATAIDLQGVEGRVSTAELNIDALNGEIRTAVAQGSASLFSEAGAETIIDTLVSLDTARDLRRQNTGTLAFAETLLTAKIEEGVSAQAEQRAVLVGVVNNNTALIVEESVARATADEAISTQLTGVVARVDDNEAAIISETQARATADEAIASQITVINAEVDDAKGLILQESVARVNADNAITQEINFQTSRIDGNVAAIASEASTRASADEAIANQITVLNAEVDDAKGLISSESIARANADNAITQELNLQISRINSNEAAIVSEASTRADADSALVTQINGVSAVANGRNRTFRQSTAPTSPTTGDLWFDTANGNIAKRWSGSSWVTTDDTRISGNEAAILAEATVRADNDNALVSAINTAWAFTGATNAVSQSGQNLVTNWTSAQANRWNQLESEVFTSGGQTIRAALAEEATVRANADGTLYAQYTVKVDQNGYVSGFGFASTANNAAPFSEFTVLAHRFAVVTPGAAPRVPFFVQGGMTYIDSAMIGSIQLIGLNKFDVKSATVGARMEMDSRSIKVFDANNVLRVQLGDLTA